MGDIRGWGITLNNDLRFAFEHPTTNVESLDPDSVKLKEQQDELLKEINSKFHIHLGKDKTGDIQSLENLLSFAELIREETRKIRISNELNEAAVSQDSGIDLVIADGGIDMEGDEVHQEFRMRRLLLSQVLCMFLTLREGIGFILIRMHYRLIHIQVENSFAKYSTVLQK